MRTKIFIAVCIGLCSLWGNYGQELPGEMESAEISTEAYSDEFQEHFFEALREKGIENYEKAVEKLLECKKMEPDNDVVDYELGRNYLALKQYDRAETALLTAVEKNPELWYLDALFSVYEARNDSDKAIEVGRKLAEANGKYKENLVRIYINTEMYGEALTLIEELDARQGRSGEREKQRVWIETRMRQREGDRVTVREENPETGNEEENNLEEIYRKISNYKRLFNHREVLDIAGEALEEYPEQPGLYYEKAYALNRLKKHGEAVKVLQTALDFLVDDVELENNIYREFVIAYNSQGDHKKADEYSRKIKGK